MKKSIKYQIVFAIVALFAALLAGIFAGGAREFYTDLAKPPFSPPGWLFPVVWTVLYILMGVGAGLVFSAPRNASQKPLALGVFFIQLAATIFWCYLFFSLRMFKVAVLWLIFLIFLVALMIFYFAKIQKAAAVLQIPYILWLLFAAYLNIGVAALN